MAMLMMPAGLGGRKHEDREAMTDFVRCLMRASGDGDVRTVEALLERDPELLNRFQQVCSGMGSSISFAALLISSSNSSCISSSRDVGTVEAEGDPEPLNRFPAGQQQVSEQV